MATETESDEVTRLEDVYALQIIPVYQDTFDKDHALLEPGRRQAIYGYELNLVLKNGERVTVVNHGDRNRLCEDAATISRLIGRPVWDAVDWILDYFEANLSNREGRQTLGKFTLQTMMQERQRSRRTESGRRP